MRIQTSFEKFAQMTNGSLFSFCFVGLRLLLGLLALILVINATPDAAFTLAGQTQTFAVINMVAEGMLAVCFLLGLLVRPAVLILMVLIVVMTFADPGLAQHASQALPTLGFIFLLGMFASGGSGHMFGLDGIIYRNIRRPSRLAKLLFG